MNQAERVLGVGNTLGEGPLWTVNEQALYWVDIKNNCYHRLEPVTGKHEVVDAGFPIGALAMRASGGLVMATGEGFVFWDSRTHKARFVVDPEAGNPDTRFNDGAVDRNGRFWAGTMNETYPERAEGCLYRLDADSSLHTMETCITVSNGIGWSPDNKTMYFTDSLCYVIYAYDYEPETGAIANRRPFVRISPEQGIPDGLTVDSEGFVWSALFGGWKVLRFDANGKVDCDIRLPVANPTSCAFGGEHLADLYITTARLGLSEEQRKKQPMAGDLFCFRTETMGLEEPVFLG